MLWTIVCTAILLLTVVVDRVSKSLVLAHLYEGDLALIPDVLHFTYLENRGMAFGLLADHRWVFLSLSVVGIALMTLYLILYAKRPMSRIALPLIIGGGIGNMIDRVMWGFVVDFINFCAFPTLWSWIFNVADAAVCVGGFLFAIDLVLETVQEVKTQKQAASTPSPKENEDGRDT